MTEAFADLAGFFLAADEFQSGPPPTYMTVPTAAVKAGNKLRSSRSSGGGGGGGAGGGGISSTPASARRGSAGGGGHPSIGTDSNAPRPLSATFRCHAACGVIVLLAFLVRYSVSAGSYSGRSAPPMYGDYEAQRHWMEVTLALPVSAWYVNGTDNDLQYWGLDYPPLTAYVSYVCGRFAQFIVPELVQLHASRGHESLIGQQFMRATVMVCDFLIFIPSVWVIMRVLAAERTPPPLPPPPPPASTPATQTLPSTPATSASAKPTLSATPTAGVTASESLLTLRTSRATAASAAAATAPTDSDSPSSTSVSASASPLTAPIRTLTNTSAALASALHVTTSTIVGSRHLMSLVILYLHPAFILIDHGHFQYNCVSLGLAVAAIYFCTTHPTECTIAFSSGSGGVNGTGRAAVPTAAPATANSPQPHGHSHAELNPSTDTNWYPSRVFIGSVLFVCSFLFKQMNLYYAPAFFAFLLGRAVTPAQPNQTIASAAVVRRIAWLGVAVLGTAGVLFAPFVWAGGVEGGRHVLTRMFPFARGLFEDKVANFWCSSNLLIKWNVLFPRERLVALSLICTVLCLLPACVLMFRRPTRISFLYGVTISAFSFYLFSFQVHEKTILQPLLPLSLLTLRHPKLVAWAGTVATFSMYPLLVKDGQTVPYFVLQVLFWAIASAAAPTLESLEPGIAAPTAPVAPIASAASTAVNDASTAVPQLPTAVSGGDYKLNSERPLSPIGATAPAAPAFNTSPTAKPLSPATPATPTPSPPVAPPIPACDVVPGWLLPISIDTCMRLSGYGMAAIHFVAPRLPHFPRYPDITNYVFTLFAFAHFVLFLALLYHALWRVSTAPPPPPALSPSPLAPTPGVERPKTA